MTMHQSEWERLSVEEKLDHLRLHQVAQDGLILAVLRGLEQLGIEVVLDDEPDGDAA